ncbi:hypothetical protein NE237_028416 [Protea cynaroides]|uniref:Uncharacterized protein n=1 Tax=Protea cynaroides TaxID=273540 RepID=A0A9Q0GQA4_9MAGN|nr:hypothetical protein NE237_028416 [Protea cynaroides]
MQMQEVDLPEKCKCRKSISAHFSGDITTPCINKKCHVAGRRKVKEKAAVKLLLSVTFLFRGQRENCQRASQPSQLKRTEEGLKITTVALRFCSTTACLFLSLYRPGSL